MRVEPSKDNDGSIEERFDGERKRNTKGIKKYICESSFYCYEVGHWARKAPPNRCTDECHGLSKDPLPLMQSISPNVLP